MANTGSRQRLSKKAHLLWLGVAVSTLLSSGGCHTSHPQGPVMDLYTRDGGPPFERSPGVYDPLVVDAFFKSHPAVLPSFVDHGVCSLKTDPASNEATAKWDYLPERSLRSVRHRDEEVPGIEPVRIWI